MLSARSGDRWGRRTDLAPVSAGVATPWLASGHAVQVDIYRFLVTHDHIEAPTTADRVACVNAGRIGQVG